MTDPDFKNCPKCGRVVNINNHKGIYSITCDCGLCVPGLRSREIALKGWNLIIDRYKGDSNEKR